ncbi:hypothetical protein HK096_006611, partial [Nowakowskiella sp. JEL0078]
MGKRGRGRGRGRSGHVDGATRQKRDRDSNIPGERKNYELAVTNNADFIAYYKDQNILSDEEFVLFLDSLKTPLPTSFRFTGSRLNTLELKDNMVKAYFPDLLNVKIAGDDGSELPLQLPDAITWYPNNAAWQWQTSKRELKKNAALARFHQFLHAETEMGNISRQEAVSMIPPLLLDVQSHHAVLDMCAAPGSKTAQLIEAVQTSEAVIPSIRSSESKCSSILTVNIGGFVIANDSDYNRSHMLVRQTKRLQSPCILVTNHEAQHFPTLYKFPRGHPQRGAVQFDRILCDVPCSGDGAFILSMQCLKMKLLIGTLRKNRGIWKTWHRNHANALHRLQVMILSRAVELLKVGGRVVYSTCSFNPVENEAVVLHVLRKSGGALRIVDVSHNLPELKRAPGVEAWKISSKSSVMYDRWEDVPVADREDEKKLRESMFGTVEDSRNVRIFPHMQNTGGFFVAVIEKVANYGPIDVFLTGENDEIVEDLETKEEDVSGEKRKREDTLSDTVSDDFTKKSKVEEEALSQQNPEELTEGKELKTLANPNLKMAWKGREKPFFFAENDSEIDGFSDMYGLDKSFPRDQFVVRTDALKHQTVYFVSAGVKMVLETQNSYRLT